MVDQWELATKRLIELTEAGKLGWRAVHPSNLLRHAELQILPPAFVAETSGKRILVFEYKRDESEPLVGLSDTGVVIEFVNELDEPQWQWPAPTSRFELLDAIRYQFSDADLFLKSFLPQQAS
jgi:hypothetical protein